MWIIGCDYHPSFQRIAMMNTEGGEYRRLRLEHMGEAEQFYRGLAGEAVRVGMEASGHSRWFEALLAELGMELWIGHPSAIRAAAPRKQKTDARDAAHLLRLLESGQFEGDADPGADGRRVGRAAVGAASASAGGNPDASEEPVTLDGSESRHGAQNRDYGAGKDKSSSGSCGCPRGRRGGGRTIWNCLSNCRNAPHLWIKP